MEIEVKHEVKSILIKNRRTYNPTGRRFLILYFYVIYRERRTTVPGTFIPFTPDYVIDTQKHWVAGRTGQYVQSLGSWLGQ